MKLAAQRNIGIELFDAGPDDLVLVGTLLDNEHLIKLEINIYLPDEQITRSKLEMIRVPFPVCHEVEAVAERLVGLRIERGVINEISRRVGGRVGCSHIKELASAVVYFGASNLVRRRAGVDPMDTEFARRSPDERFTLTKELLQDTCLAYCQTTPQGLDDQIGIKRIGEEHTHPQPLGDFEPSFGVLLKDRAERWGDKTYLRYRKGDELCAMSFREFADKTFQIARHLIDRKIRPGDRIALLCENRPEMYLMEMAAMSIGALTVPIFAGYPAAQVSYPLEHARPCMLVVSGNHQLEKIARDRLPWVKNFYCMDFDAQSAAWGAIDFASLTVQGGATQAQLDERIEAVHPGDLCMVMYTSGTTGSPKGVQLTHRNLISQQKALSLIWDVKEDDVLLGYLPWHHSFGGLFERFMTLYRGCEFCLDDSRGRNLDRLIENWNRCNPTIFFSVPHVHDALITRCREQSNVEDIIFGGRLRFVFTAGAPLPAPIETAYRERKIPVLEGWGLTETSPCVTVTTKDRAWRSGYVGLPIPGVRVRIDSDQEMLVKGPNVMVGYLDEEEATSYVIDDDGWLHTGDLGEFTPDGFRIFGRKDGAFKLTTGEKVHPHRIENVFADESPYIHQAVVLGSGKNYIGMLIYPDFSRLQEWAREHRIVAEPLIEQPAVRDLYAAELKRINPLIVVKYHRILRAVLADAEPSLADGELTPSGKIVRKVVTARYSHKIHALFSPRSAP